MQLVPTQHSPSHLDPTTTYFQAVQGTLQAFQDGSLGQVTSGVGQAMVTTTPIVAAARAMRARRRRGVGQVATPPAHLDMPVWVAGTVLILAGVLSYQAGKAMAPNRKAARTWGWIGAPVGMLTGPWGLGIMGIVSNSRRS